VMALHHVFTPLGTVENCSCIF